MFLVNYDNVVLQYQFRYSHLEVASWDRLGFTEFRTMAHLGKLSESAGG